MSFYSGAGPAGNMRERPKYPGPRVLFLAMLCGAWGLAGIPCAGQAPEGGLIAFGPAAVPGIGVTVGGVSAGRFLTREAVLAAGYRSSSDGSIRTSATIGGSIRLLNARRTVLGLAYNGLDLDVGFRMGPAVLFRFEESTFDRNKRFALVADPFVRVVYRRGAFFFFEAAIHRPAFRMGIWLPV